VCSEQENAYHGDSRSGVPRVGHCASAVPSLRHQAGARTLRPLYWPWSRFLGLHSLARPSLCALASLALRRTSDGETMTTPGGTRTACYVSQQPPRARRIGFYHGVGAPTGSLPGAPILRSAPARCSKPPVKQACFSRRIIPDGDLHLLRRLLALSGRPGAYLLHWALTAPTGSVWERRRSMSAEEN
jgi:hypothetical protein